jgi:uncharacterized protein DUF2846
VHNVGRRAAAACRGLRGPSGDAPSAGHCAAAPAGQARIWFYRDWEPSESLNLANIDVNGVYFGSVENGSAFYRDVPAGQYYIAPQSDGHDFNQDKDIELGADQRVYVKIVSLRAWELGVGGDESNFDRDTFYAWLMPAEVARSEIARDRAGI